MKRWTLYLPDVLPEVKLCPQPLAVQKVREAAIELCVESKVWQQIQDPYSITSGELAYEFDVDTGSLVTEIMTAQLQDGRDLDIRTPEWCDENFPLWRTGLAGTPCAITQIQPDEFRLAPQPATTMELTLTVALKPTRDSTQGPDFLFDDYYKAICASAKSMLMLMARQPWSNPNQAAIYAGMATSEASKARVRVQRAFGRAPTRVRAQFL